MELSRLVLFRRITRMITNFTNNTYSIHSAQFVILVSTGFLFLAALAGAEEKAPPSDHQDKVSYSIGIKLGKSLQEVPFTLNLDLVTRGIEDVFSGAEPLMTEQEINETMAAFQKEMTMKVQEQMKVLGENNRKEGEVFLAENKKKEEVAALPSGLQYKVLNPGTGKKPRDIDTVTVHYRGTLIDGTQFDSSYLLGQPVTFPVKGVIRGWTEALQLMQEGAKWQLFIPSDLAYGERGAGGKVGPNATLVFEMELISVQEKK